AKHFMEVQCREHRREPPELPAEFVDALVKHDWPGNVRELENYMARAVVLSEGGKLNLGLVGLPGQFEKPWKPLKGGKPGDLKGLIQELVRVGIQTLPDSTLNREIVDGVERELIEQVMALCDDVQVKAAAKLGINRNTLYKKVMSYRGSGNGNSTSGE